MNTRIKHDDGNLIWFDFNTINVKSLDKSVISHFDITNMPVTQFGYNILGEPRMEPDFFELENYHVSFFQDHLSTTGWSCMCINKSREIYNTKAGYINGQPDRDLY